jgi:hypothetical protein
LVCIAELRRSLWLADYVLSILKMRRLSERFLAHLTCIAAPPHYILTSPIIA